MKQRLERGRARLTRTEEERIWSALRDAVPRTHRSGRRWAIPAAAFSALGAMALVLLLVRSGQTPSRLVEEASRPRVVEIAPGRAPDTARALVEKERRERDDAARQSGTTGPAYSMGREEHKKADERATEAAPPRSEPQAGPEPVDARPGARAEDIPPIQSAPVEAGDASLDEQFEDRAILSLPDVQGAAEPADAGHSLGGAGDSPSAEAPATASGNVEERSAEETVTSLDALSLDNETMGSFLDLRARAPSPPRAMYFAPTETNGFVDTRDDAEATFAVDVDNASYTLARSYLERGLLPPREAIRVEEFINAFPHDYEPPQGRDIAAEGGRHADEGTFAIHLDAAPSAFGEGLTLFRVGLKGREVADYDRKPMSLVFVVDVSGSMAQGGRIELLKEGLIDLLYRLNGEDRVGLVTFESTATVVLPLTSLERRSDIERAITALTPRGSTNAADGLRLAYRILDEEFDSERTNRVLLCSDGVANTGVTDADEILRLIKTNTGRGIFLTSLGVGMGNYNDALLEQLANEGDGNYYYVDTPEEAKRVLVERYVGTLETIARDVKIQVAFDPATVERYRLIGYENRDVRDRDFRNDAVDAGEVGAGHEVTALFELELRSDEPRGEGHLAVVRVRSEDPSSGRVREDSRSFGAREIARRFDRAPLSFQLDAAVAEFAEILRGSTWADDGDLAAVAELVERVAQEPPRRASEVTELGHLVERARAIAPRDEPVQWRERHPGEPGAPE